MVLRFDLNRQKGLRRTSAFLLRDVPGCSRNATAPHLRLTLDFRQEQGESTRTQPESPAVTVAA